MLSKIRTESAGVWPPVPGASSLLSGDVRIAFKKISCEREKGFWLRFFLSNQNMWTYAKENMRPKTHRIRIQHIYRCEDSPPVPRKIHRILGMRLKKRSGFSQANKHRFPIFKFFSWGILPRGFVCRNRIFPLKTRFRTSLKHTLWISECSCRAAKTSISKFTR